MRLADGGTDGDGRVEICSADGAMSVVLIGLTFHYGDLFKPTSHADNLDSTANCLFC